MTLAPRVLRELSWAASKLREVARVLSAMEVRLTVAPESGRMTVPGAGKRGTMSTRPGLELEPEWVQLPIPFREEYSDEDLSTGSAPASGSCA